ncbi:hypothetical protein LguiB_006444 [Lonicera macranthoides]
MMMKQNSDTTAAVACGNCGVEERRLLHHVRHRGSFRRLCTSCVLRLHPHSFCPTCFVVYDSHAPSSSPHAPPPSPDAPQAPPSSADAVTCSKCFSTSHSGCVGGGVSYVCPPCANPNSPIFVPKKVNGDGEKGSFREIDKNSARILLAAARIAAMSMGKAAVAARAEAERRAKEASFTRKRAREALEHVACLVNKEKLKKKDNLSGEVSGSGKLGQQGNGGGAAVSAVNAEQNNPVGNRSIVERVDGSSEVLAALNAVELKERERLEVMINPQNVISVAPVDCVPMDVDNHDRLGVNSVSNNEDPNVNLGHLDEQNAQGEKASNGSLSVPPADELMRSNFKEEKIDRRE